MSAFDDLLAAIQNQRWYFFENNALIIFDRDTALLWADLNHFPFRKKNGNNYSSLNFYDEVKTLLSDTNAQNFGDYSDWKIPTPEELWQMIEDKTFPYQNGGNWRILNKFQWCVFNNQDFVAKDLDDFGATADISDTLNVAVIPCIHSLVTKNYSATPQEVLEIFIKNNLVPKFADANAGKLFAEYKASLDKTAPAAAKTAENLNYKNLLANYDLETIARSPIQYYNAVRQLADEMLENLQRYETARGKQIGEIS